jgi:hypothetical protein
MAVPDSVRGKKVRCKGCGGVIPVPAAQAVDTRMTTAEAQAKKAANAPTEEEDAKNPYGVTETSLSPRCPHCAYELDPPDARICLHCGYDMVKRARRPSVKTYEHTFGDYLSWLAPGLACLLAVVLLVGFCIYFHYYLPAAMLPPTEADALAKDRMAAFEKDISVSAWLFHPGIELWIVVVCLFFMWKAGRYAFVRLVLNFRPPEKYKEK